MWHMRLQSAFRTTFACSIIGCVVLYGPASLRSLVKFPSYAYLTALMIMSDATLGEAIRGCWHAFSATVLVLPLSIFNLWLVGPTKFCPWNSALSVAVNTFLIALPESTHLISKRIAFGQIVLAYVGAAKYGDQTSTIMHPLQVASSTALGAIASILALLLPYPRPAYCEVRKLYRLFADNALERINLYLKAITAQNQNIGITTELISRACMVAQTGNKLVQNISVIQEGLPWETPLVRFLKPNLINPGDRLQTMERQMRGMELALTSSLFTSAGSIDLDFVNVLQTISGKLELYLGQARCFPPFNSVTNSEMKEEFLEETFLPPTPLFPTRGDLPVIFFFSSLKQFLRESSMRQNTNHTLGIHIPKSEESSHTEQHEFATTRMWNYLIAKSSYKKRLVFAARCSLSLGLAALLGLIFDKQNGYWSGLAIAISFVTGKQAIFTVANARGQGTAIGSVYGVLSCFVFQRFAKLRFLAILPWIIFTSLLRHSRMYGQVGGFSAAVGALLILGRKNYGLPSEFAIARLVEVFIGLFCFITAELLLQPSRAATLAKNSLWQSLRDLQECIEYIFLYHGQKEQPALNIVVLREKLKLLNAHLQDLNQYRLDAQMEPDFWFLPLPGICYQKLQGFLSKTEDLLHFMAYNIELLSQAPHQYGIIWWEILAQMKNEVELFKETLDTSLRCLEKTSQIRPYAVSNNLQGETTLDNLENGTNPRTCSISTTADDAAEKILISFLRLSNETTEKIRDSETEKELHRKMVLSLSAMGFCIHTLMIEIKGIEKTVRQLIQ